MVANVRDMILYLRTRYDGKPFRDAADDLDRVDRHGGKAGKALRGMSDDAARLRTEINRTNGRIRELHTQIARTGDLSLFKDIGQEQRRAKQLQRVLDALVPDARRVGERSGMAFGGGMRDGFSLTSPLLIGAIGEAVVLALPGLGAMVAGAVTGVVGVGGIAGGIAAASKDPGVRRAAYQFSKDISAEFFSSGGAFVQPTIDALSILQAAFRDLDLGDSFQRVAPYVEELARGIAGLGREFMPPFNRALDAAGPALEALSMQLPRLGGALGSMLELMATSDGTVEGMVALMNLLSNTAIGLGETISFLGDMFDRFTRRAATISGIWEDIPLLGRPYKWLNDQLENFIGASDEAVSKAEELGRSHSDLSTSLYTDADAAEKAKKAIDDMNRAVDDAMRDSMSAAAAADNYEAAIDSVTQSFKDNGRTIDVNTEKGRANRQALRDLVAAAQRVRDANIANGMSMSDANAIYETQIGVVERLAKKYGVTKQELEKLAGKYTIDVVATTYYHTRGSPPTFLKSGAYAGDLRIEYGRITARQHGGPVGPYETILVGEKRPEVLQMGSRGGYVHPSVESWMGGGVDYDRLAAAIAKALRAAPPSPVVNVRAYSDRFSIRQVLDDLAWHGAH